MNLVDDFKEVSARIVKVNELIKNYSDEEKVRDGEKVMMELLGSSVSEYVEGLKRELEGLLITEAWLKDTLTHYIEEEGFSIDLNYTHVMGEDK